MEGQFNIGTSNAQTHEKKADVAQERMTKTLGIKDDKNVKREREEYAVNLRKNKRDDLMKRRRGIGNSQPDTPAGTILEGTDFSKFTIEEALNYQKEHNINLEDFTGNIANKIKIVITDFSLLNKMIYQDDITCKLMAVVGMRKLLSIETSPPIQAVIDANLIQVFIEMLHHEIPKF